MSARTSTRLKARQTQPRQTGSETVAVSYSERLKNMKPPAKRQKTTTANTKTKAVTKRGKGKNKKKQETFLIELPLDVFFEIFKYLQPLDLLNLSYTAKELRSILTAEYASSIWKKAYANLTPLNGVLPPECPSRVDIRHYTSVLFGRNCLFCAAPNANIVHSGALTRLCNTCARNELWLYDPDPYPSKLTVGMNRDINYDIARYCWVRSISNNDNALKSGRYFLKRQYERLVSELQQCISIEAQARYKAMIWNKSNYARFPEQVETWCNAVAQQEAKERRLVLEERRRLIRMKLAEEGYIDLCGYDIENLPGVKKATPLTDKEWNKIKNKLISPLELYLQDEKRKRFEDTFTERLTHLSELLKTFLESQPRPWIYAPLPSIAKLEPFARIVRDIGINEDKRLAQLRLSRKKNHIPALLATCRAEFDEFLLGLLIGDEGRITHVGGKDFDRTPLDLATTFFKCRQCIEIDPISYPRILMHECLRKRTTLDTLIDEEPPVVSYGVPIVTAQHVWNRMSSWYGPTWNEMHQYISIDDDATRSATAIVLACGENPKTFTAAALKELDVRLECMRCVPDRAGAGCWRHIMSWNMAILHDISKHPNDISTEGWSLVTAEDDLARAKKLEDKALRSSRQKLWEHCLYCDSNVRTNVRTFGAEDHLLHAHRITISESEPEALKSHVYIAVDAPLDAYPCAVMI